MIPGFRSLKRKEKCRAPARLRFGPDAPTGALHDLLAKSEPDSGTLERGPVEPFEDSEDLLQIFGLDPDAVIAHTRTAMRSRHPASHRSGSAAFRPPSGTSGHCRSDSERAGQDGFRAPGRRGAHPLQRAARVSLDNGGEVEERRVHRRARQSVVGDTWERHSPPAST